MTARSRSRPPCAPGERPARDVLEEHLARIDARASRLHAFNLVLADEAAPRPTRSTPRSRVATIPGRSPGVPIALKDNLCTRGVPTTCSSRILEGWRPPYDATVVRAAARRGRGDGRQDQPRRVRDGQLHRELRVRADAQPPRPRAGARRVERRLGGRGRGRVRAARARLRHRRLDPPARGAVRRGRREADLRRGVPLRARSRSRRRSTRSGRSPTTVDDAALLLDVIGGHDPLRLDVDRRRRRRRCSTELDGASRACASASSRSSPTPRASSPR